MWWFNGLLWWPFPLLRAQCRLEQEMPGRVWYNNTVQVYTLEVLQAWASKPPKHGHQYKAWKVGAMLNL
jgi:hypothetical protein